MKNFTSEISHVFWDWNGTLLNDTDACIASMNNILSRRDMPEISIHRYKDIFTFPVIDYYKELGFDFRDESFEDLSVEFIEGYQSKAHLNKIADGALEILKKIQSLGIKQVIVSAMRQDMLLQQVEENGLTSFFDAIHGIDHIYADNKAHLAEKYLADNNIDDQKVVFIGDTLHDWEVADSLKLQTILVSSGHQSNKILQQSTAVICNNLPDVLSLMQ